MIFYLKECGLIFDLIIKIMRSNGSYVSDKAPFGISSPADKQGVLSRTHKAHFPIAYVSGPTDPLLLLL
jgi:hypothetical protein